MNKLKEHKNYKILIGLLLGILISATGVYAATTYVSKDVFYNTGNSSLSNSDVQGAIDELADKYKNFTGCPSNYACVQKKTTLALGDYVSMTPTKGSYTTDTSMTGYTSTQTINPRELYLWRVIKLNDDGTVEMISEHISSVYVSFKGKTGYQNLVGYLNVLASQYENSTYTSGSRYFGYSSQTDYISDSTIFTSSTARILQSTKNNVYEKQGGGDMLCTTDFSLVKNALGTLKATLPKTTGTYKYWIASRYYRYSSSTSFSWHARTITTSGNMEYNEPIMYSHGSSGYSEYSKRYALRPIVVLKSGLKYSGLGTEDHPMRISTS